MIKNEELEQLEQALKGYSIKIIYDTLHSEGGLCRVKDRYYVIINRYLNLDEKIELLSRSLMEYQDIISAKK
jgi:hypothetical protein